MQQAIVEVLLPLALETSYSYLAPEGMGVEPGSYVLVPLGTRHVIGVVWGERTEALPAEKASKLRCIEEVFDHPPMPGLQRQFIDWLAKYYVAPAGMVLRMCLRVPSALEPAQGRSGYASSGKTPAKMTAARRRVLEILKEARIALAARDIADLAGVGPSVVKGLAAEGVLETVELPAFRRFDKPDIAKSGIALSAAQHDAAQVLIDAVERRNHSVTLIDGVTGSGKTEVYFEAMAKAVAAGGQVLLLVPEIALTGQFIDRVEERFGARPAEWHSDMRPRERERVWRGVASGEAKILVGARSALFLPWRELSLIVVDEEHEGAFKQEDGIPYHARDMAVDLWGAWAFPVILSSATPSLESLVNVDRGRYGRVMLKDRIGRAGLPKIDLIDMRAATPAAGRWISEPLAQAIGSALAQGEQALLFLNRRGYAPLTCAGHADTGSNVPIARRPGRAPLPAHSACATTAGTSKILLNVCRLAAARVMLVPCGPGVERLAEEVQACFPHARSDHSLQRPHARRGAERNVARGEGGQAQSDHRHAARGEGPSFPRSDPCRNRRCRSGARDERSEGWRTNVPVVVPGVGPGRARRIGRGLRLVQTYNPRSPADERAPTRRQGQFHRAGKTDARAGAAAALRAACGVDRFRRGGD